MKRWASQRTEMVRPNRSRRDEEETARTQGRPIQESFNDLDNHDDVIIHPEPTME